LEERKRGHKEARFTITSLREAQTGVAEPAVRNKKTIVNKVKKQSEPRRGEGEPSWVQRGEERRRGEGGESDNPPVGGCFD
jgi:hypothetical protein